MTFANLLRAKSYTEPVALSYQVGVNAVRGEGDSPAKADASNGRERNKSGSLDYFLFARENVTRDQSPVMSTNQPSRDASSFRPSDSYSVPSPFSIAAKSGEYAMGLVFTSSRRIRSASMYELTASSDGCVRSYNLPRLYSVVANPGAVLLHQ